MQRLSWLLFACILILACGTLIAADDADTKALIALDEEWSKAAVAHDADKVASFYAEDAHLYPPNEPGFVGRDKARESWAKTLSDPNVTVSWKTTSAGIDGNTGWTAGTTQASIKGADGKTTVQTGKYLCVWKKGPDGKWKAVHDMWNNDSK
ncbi:MAG TPA: DUF4440 domain-containing protein [Terriglobales bacterium]|nr:DUF4440 domain-containing protein [Terriglobales bacterium]